MLPLALPPVRQTAVFPCSLARTSSPSAPICLNGTTTHPDEWPQKPDVFCGFIFLCLLRCSGVLVYIDGNEQKFARYLLPESVAQYLSFTPVGFHQEYFGGSTGALDKAKGLIRYRDIHVRDEGGREWKLPCWRIVSVIDDAWETKDKRFGWSVEYDNLVSRCGHLEDTQEALRERGQVLLLRDSNFQRQPETIINKWTETKF